MSGRGGSALGCRPPRVHSPAFPQRGRVTDLDGHAVTLLIHLHPDRIGFVEFERVIFGITRNEDRHRFPRGQHTIPHVALRKQMLARSEHFTKGFLPIPNRLAIYIDDDVPDNGRTNPFVSQAEMNVGRIAAAEFENRPDRRTHLLMLDVSRITGHAQSTEPDKGRNNCVVSAGATCFLFFRHDADHIAVGLSVYTKSSRKSHRSFEVLRELTAAHRGYTDESM